MVTRPPAPRGPVFVRGETLPAQSLEAFQWASWGVNVGDINLDPIRYHWIYRGVRILCDAVSGARFAVYRGEQGDDNEVETANPVAAIWSAPNSYQSAAALWGQTTAHCLITGGAVLWKRGKGDDPIKPNEIPAYIHTFPITSFLPNRSSSNLVPESFSLAGYERRKILPHEVIILPELVTVDPWSPIGPVQTLIGPLAAAKYAEEWNAAFFKNGAMPSTIVLFKQAPTADQLSKARQEFAQLHGGARNNGRPAFMGGVEQVIQSPGKVKDMDFPATRSSIVEAVAGVLGVPKILLGVVEDHNRATATVAEATMWTYELLPRLTRWAAAINRDARTWTGAAGLVVGWDTDDVPALQSYRLDRADTAKALWDMGWPADDVSERLGLGMPHAEGTDLPWGGKTADAASASPAEPGAEPAPMPMDDAEDEPEPAKADAVRAPSADAIATAREWLAEVMDPTEHAIHGKVKRHVFAIRKDVLDALGDLTKDGEVPETRGPGITIATAARLWAKERQWNAQLVDMMLHEWFEGAKRALVFARKTIGPNAEVPLTDNALMYAMATKTVKVVDINKTIREDIREAVIKGLEAGETEEQIAKRIKRVMNASTARAKTIARTEASQATHIAVMASYRAAGVKRHQWITEGDEKVRSSHDRNHGVIRIVGKKFPNGIVIPGDLSGPPHETINCRCTTIPVEDR